MAHIKLYIIFTGEIGATCADIFQNPLTYP